MRQLISLDEEVGVVQRNDHRQTSMQQRTTRARSSIHVVEHKVVSSLPNVPHDGGGDSGCFSIAAA
jgi:hypothetical protein